MPEANETRTEKGISLARGPALILGTVLLAAGLYFLYKEHFFPKFSNFPNGKAPVEGKVFGIFGSNGWTGMLTAVAGGLLLFGAASSPSNRRPGESVAGCHGPCKGSATNAGARACTLVTVVSQVDQSSTPRRGEERALYP